MAIQDDNTILNKGDLKAYHEAIAPMLGGTFMVRTNNSDYYSTDEKIIGVWVDGKPLYSKTLTGSTSVAGDAWSDTGIVAPSNIVLIDLLPIRYLDGSQFQTIPCIGYIDENNHHLQIFNIRNNTYAVSPIYATIYYTKTTDAAGSATTTPGAYDINFPNTWPKNKEIYFGNGVYGIRKTGSMNMTKQAHNNVDCGVTAVTFVNQGGHWKADASYDYPFGCNWSGNGSSSIAWIDHNSSNQLKLAFWPEANITNSAYDVWVTYSK